ncbi:YfbM family protein [Cnuibacter physcomitrellae]|uniref:YfbM family protein n=1 Tax=Cnuibacter physcomitrellae TaxID=1619308 RepID=UPI002175CEA0|nr:YfbM family protein [Cnuibacter physcomitrellae]MCS5497795.1 YfbM family protein [Cnuibacter physcomitrellae]
MQRGLHLRLTPAEAARVLVTAGDDPALRAALAALEEDVATSGRAGEIDKAWDPIACALAPEGPAADWPARGVIGGARSLQHDADASWVTHSSPAEVRDVAAFLAALTDHAFRTAHTEMPDELRNPEHGPDEESYALSWLARLREFYAAAAASGQHVVFSVGF